MKKLTREQESFVNNYVKDLEQGSAAIFAGAGLSKSCGYVDWKDLLRDIAYELGLDVDKEYDLISLAQFHVNQTESRNGIARKILEEFSSLAELSESHKILARLPVHTYWTSNYDTLIETSLKENYRVADVKRRTTDLTMTKPKRDAVVYKMHGDVESPNEAILYKSQYEQYHNTHAAFITALSGDLVSKTFLFIGFSFTDPNLDYILSRLHVPKDSLRTHYCFVKKEKEEPLANETQEMAEYRARRQKHYLRDLLRFGIQAVLVEEYDDIPFLLKEIESRFLKKTIFISGSAEEYGDWERQDALNFIHELSYEAIKNGYRIVNGFGWGIGSAVINGALEAIYSNPEKYSEEQLVMRPFPQHQTQGKSLPVLWHEYRERMIKQAGIALFLFGNKKNSDGEIVNADGVRKEFEIAQEQDCLVIPVGCTGYMADELAKEVLADDNFSTKYSLLRQNIEDLAEFSGDYSQLVVQVIELFNKLQRV